MIPNDILAGCKMAPMQDYADRHGNTADTKIGFYETFLVQTDYVAAKLAEASYLGKTVDPKYVDILQYRQEAREAINALQGGGGNG